MLSIICIGQHKDNFAKNYATDCKACADPWVGEIYYKTWGVCPSPWGGQDWMCNVKEYNNASWNDRNQLTGFIRGKFTGIRASGNIYIFIVPEKVNFYLGTAGHIGWAFQLADGSLYGGSTENNGAHYKIDPGRDNDFWAERFISEFDMFKKFKSLGYSAYKVINVQKPKILAAKLRSEECMMKGFQGVSNNCLDHTYQIFEAYGLNGFTLPNRQVFSFPNRWFQEFYQNVNGNGWNGKAL